MRLQNDHLSSQHHQAVACRLLCKCKHCYAVVTHPRQRIVCSLPCTCNRTQPQRMCVFRTCQVCLIGASVLACVEADVDVACYDLHTCTIDVLLRAKPRNASVLTHWRTIIDPPRSTGEAYVSDVSPKSSRISFTTSVVSAL